MYFPATRWHYVVKLGEAASQRRQRQTKNGKKERKKISRTDLKLFKLIKINLTKVPADRTLNQLSHWFVAKG